jgi:hypothetical protein
MKRIKKTCYCGCPMGTEEYPDGKDEFTFSEVNCECPTCVANGGEYAKSPYWTDACTELKKREKFSPPPMSDITPLKGHKIVPLRSAR